MSHSLVSQALKKKIQIIFCFLLLSVTSFAAETPTTSTPTNTATPPSEAAVPTEATETALTIEEEVEPSTSPSPESTVPPLPSELYTELSEDLVFKQTEQVFLFGSHAEQAGVLKRLLLHYQTHLKELETLSAPPKETQAALPNPITPTTPTTPAETPNPATPETSETSETSTSTTTPPTTPPTTPSTETSEETVVDSTPPANPSASYSPLYRYFYKPVLDPLFIKEQKPEISLILLDWIVTLPLPEEVVFIEKILKHSETKKTATPLSLNLKNKALRALETLDLDTPRTLALLKSYLTDEKVNLEKTVLIESAAAALSGKGGSEISKELKKLFETTSQDDLKVTLLRSLSQFKNPKDIDFLVDLLDSREVGPVIWTALVELMHYPTSSQAEETLLTYANDEDIKLSSRAIYALSTFTTEPVYKTLLEATKHNNPIVRSEALKALSKQEKHQEDISELLPLLQYKYKHDSDSLVKKTAKKILEQREIPLEESP